MQSYNLEKCRNDLCGTIDAVHFLEENDIISEIERDMVVARIMNILTKMEGVLYIKLN